MPSMLPPRPAAPTPLKTYQAATMTECLLAARRELGPDAEIVAQRKFKRGALFGRWGGTEMIEVTCRLSPVPSQPFPSPPGLGAGGQRIGEALPPAPTQLQTLEARLSELTASVQGLVDAAKKKPFQPAPFAAAGAPAPVKSEGRGRAARLPQEAEPYLALMQRLLDAEVAPVLARQIMAGLPAGLCAADAQTELRTRLSQRLKIDARPTSPVGGRPRLLAFVGTTGVGKTTTIAKLAARHALVERRRVGIITLDTYRLAASQQLQTYGDVLNVPVRVAHDQAELARHLAEFTDGRMELVLLDTAGRSPNDMIPLAETAHLFQDMEAVEKFLTVPATLSARDMENVVARFQHALAPDALILTKLDEATDSACFGKLLTVQARHGLPLAYVTTGQRVPDDIAVPDAHAIAARLVSTALP